MKAKYKIVYLDEGVSFPTSDKAEIDTFYVYWASKIQNASIYLLMPFSPTPIMWAVPLPIVKELERLYQLSDQKDTSILLELLNLGCSANDLINMKREKVI